MDQLGTAIGAACEQALGSVRKDIKDVDTSLHAAIDLVNNRLGEFRRLIGDQSKQIRDLQEENAALKKAQAQGSVKIRELEGQLCEELAQLKRGGNAAECPRPEKVPGLLTTAGQQHVSTNQIEMNDADGAATSAQRSASLQEQQFNQAKQLADLQATVEPLAQGLREQATRSPHTKTATGLYSKSRLEDQRSDSQPRLQKQAVAPTIDLERQAATAQEHGATPLHADAHDIIEVARKEAGNAASRHNMQQSNQAPGAAKDIARSIDEDQSHAIQVAAIESDTQPEGDGSAREEAMSSSSTLCATDHTEERADGLRNETLRRNSVPPVMRKGGTTENASAANIGGNRKRRHNDENGKQSAIRLDENNAPNGGRKRRTTAVSKTVRFNVNEGPDTAETDTAGPKEITTDDDLIEVDGTLLNNSDMESGLPSVAPRRETNTEVENSTLKSGSRRKTLPVTSEEAGRTTTRPKGKSKLKPAITGKAAGDQNATSKTKRRSKPAQDDVMDVSDDNIVVARPAHMLSSSPVIEPVSQPVEPTEAGCEPVGATTTYREDALGSEDELALTPRKRPTISTGPFSYIAAATAPVPQTATPATPQANEIYQSLLTKFNLSKGEQKREKENDVPFASIETKARQEGGNGVGRRRRRRHFNPRGSGDVVDVEAPKVGDLRD